MNLIGLDFDGVLNSHKWFRENGTRSLLYGFGYDFGESPARMLFEHLDPECVARLNTIVDRTDAHFVITSLWAGEGLEVLRAGLKAAGFLYPERILGVLPDLCGDRDFVSPKRDYRLCREIRFEAWVRENLNPETTSIVLLDDDNCYQRLSLFWVRTTLFGGPEKMDPAKYEYYGPYNGLQDAHVEQVVILFEAQNAKYPGGNVFGSKPHPALSEYGLQRFPASTGGGVAKPGGARNPESPGEISNLGLIKRALRALRAFFGAFFRGTARKGY